MELASDDTSCRLPRQGGGSAVLRHEAIWVLTMHREGIPQADVDQFDAACKRAGVRRDVTVYPGAPHSFFDRKQQEFADASTEGWRRVRQFVGAPASGRL
jgi:carboxymethylenebutenolidase